ncbi:hypothetical protein [Sphingomonas sp. Ag1]|uniref:hypothetical protein n=1 Tax=Sphingomonas sp. Ag1 TaxID=1642949 RepID=UPI0006988C1D|nr:hypothetical protein [Sphingomonas sp. Ag1]
MPRKAPIPTSKLPSGAIEVINRNALVSLALTKGYIAFLPVYDAGVDLILYNEASNDVVKVQLKSRWTIDTKYVGRNIAIAFPDRGCWYLVPHDDLVSMAEAYGFTARDSWIRPGGSYSYAPLSRRMIQDLQRFRFEGLEQLVKQAAASGPDKSDDP